MQTNMQRHKDNYKRMYYIGHTTGGDSIYHGGPALASCTFSRNSSAFGPTISAAIICHTHYRSTAGIPKFRTVCLLPSRLAVIVFTARSLAERGIAKASCPSVCLSVCPSVTLRYRGHIGWNS